MNDARRRLKLCYFVNHGSPHSIRFLNFFQKRGHEIFVYFESGQAFYPWNGDFASSDPQVNAAPAAGAAERANVPGVVEYRESQLHRLARLAIRVFRPTYRLLRERTPLDVEAARRLWRRVRDRLSHHYGYWKRARQVNRSLRELRPDLLQTLYAAYNAIDAYLSGFQPYILTAWGSDVRDEESMSRFEFFLQRRALCSALAMTAPTQDLLRVCQNKGVRADRCHRIAMPGVNVAHFEGVQGQSMRAMLGIDAAAELVLSPRAMAPWYRIENIVRAFRVVHARRPSTHLLLLDYNRLTDEYYRDIRQLILDEGLDVAATVFERMPLPFSRMNEVYAASDCVVSVPRSDGMPQTILEAFAAGRPVVSAMHPTYEGVIIDGHSGLLVPGDDIEKIAAAILSLCSDPPLRGRLIENARRIVKEHGDINRELVKMEDLYYTLV